MTKRITDIPTYDTPTLAVIGQADMMSEICEAFQETVSKLNIPYVDIVQRLLYGTYRFGGGLFIERLRKWSKYTGIPARHILAVNLAYEIAQAGGCSPFGCTSVIMRTDDGIMHVRNMDWDLEKMGKSTVIIDAYNYLSVSNSGMLGAISGMVAGEFSITLNWATPSEIPGWDLGPLFLLQYILENAETYEEAVKLAEETRLSSSCFYSIAGAVNACVVERTRMFYKTRCLDVAPLVVTNHYVTSDMKEYNAYQDQEALDFSRTRYREATQAAKRFKSGDPLRILSGSNVRNEDTIQQMVFWPETGEYDAVAYDK